MFAEELQLLSMYPILLRYAAPKVMKGNKKRVIAIRIITYQGFGQNWFDVFTELFIVRIVLVSLQITLLFIPFYDRKLGWICYIYFAMKDGIFF